jgi:hypothetical protein
MWRITNNMPKTKRSGRPRDTSKSVDRKDKMPIYTWKVLCDAYRKLRAELGSNVSSVELTTLMIKLIFWYFDKPTVPPDFFKDQGRRGFRAA